jgi:glutaminyl-tRNA synthetase
MNPDSLKVVSGFVEPLLAEAKGSERFQFERTGYFIADEFDHTTENPVFNRTVTLKDSYKPAN